MRLQSTFLAKQKKNGDKGCLDGHLSHNEIANHITIDFDQKIS